jgi:hypothetical protein
MPKKIVDDVIVPEKRRSIRNIPIPAERRRTARSAESLTRTTPPRVADLNEEYSSIPPEIPPKRELPRRYRSNRKRMWLIAGATLAVIVFALLSFFDNATLAYTPKTAALTFENEIYSAAKTGEGELLYSVVKLSGDKGKAVSVSGEQDVSRKASGVIIVYNNASTQPQRLIENTRFESPSGKIYRIREAISIPGKQGDTPGTLEVTVYADEAGESYNSEPTDFTVPGLKGTPRYTTIYARSKGAITGGFVGKEKVVSEADMAKASSELRAAMGEELMVRAQAEVPPDFILFPSLSSVTFEDLPQSSSGQTGTANVNLRGHLYGIMFKRSDLSEELARNKTAFTASENVEIVSFDNLMFSFSGNPPTELLPVNKINFKVDGTAMLAWRTDEVALKSDLMGRGKKEVTSILKNYPTIVSASVNLRPFWKTAFPDEAGKISVKRTGI